ncbi:MULTISPECIES: hypothetical protein [Proteus]|jgi:hypothetical protein|uniref:Lipoprotein n=2 Tax=Proteus vulgaris TaxID=585 RepID=A0A379F3U7_PROVU|nr:MULTISPECIES: hypothetical protein [Proteus]NBN60990.1 hypothetical protein [Proteus sp. G2639]RNT29239.1 hypothetical protein B9475_008335 [Proteus mirabilis]AYY80510.1 hypothetical protein EGX81_06320 [Proteus vulgaris]KGA60680.1 hypothetical protein DR95_949 [Proteus vulgaris]MBG5972262.1 hypothetical protein [Proteus vulgaris]
MYRYFYLITVLYTISLVTGCDNPAIREKQNGVFYINNNQLELLKFTIDNTHFVMEKGEVKKIKLNDGMHVLVDSQGKKSVFMIYPGNRGGIINPDRDIYYSFTTVFKQESRLLESIRIEERAIWVNGMLVRGAIASSDSLFIDNNIFNCDIPIDESIPTYLPDWEGNEKVNVLTKCFSKDDFHQYIAKYPYGINFYSERDLLTQYSTKDNFSWIDENNTRTDSLLPLEYNFKFCNEKLTGEAKSIYKIMEQYLASRDPEEKQVFYDEYHKHVIKMAIIYNQQLQNNIFVDREAYLEFMKTNGRLFGAGILGEPILI